MKRVIKSSTSVKDQLVRQLDEDLRNTFEDNIVMRYAIYVNDDPGLELDATDQDTAWMTLNRARKKYLEAMADVIQYVDVDGRMDF